MTLPNEPGTAAQAAPSAPALGRGTRKGHGTSQASPRGPVLHLKWKNRPLPRQQRAERILPSPVPLLRINNTQRQQDPA